MQSVALESSTSVKTHSHEQSCLNFFEIAVKKRILALFLLFFLQAPILYFLYRSEVSQYWKGATGYGSTHQSVKTNSKIFEENSKLCDHSNCALRTNKSIEYSQGAINLSKELTVQGSVLSNQTTAHVTRQDVDIDIEVEETKYNDNERNLLKSSQIEVKIIDDSDDVQALHPTNDQSITLPVCSSKPSGLQGQLDISFANEPYTLKQIAEDNPLVSNGGHFTPPYCKARWKVAIIVPFRDRDEHLRYFLQYMHPILQRQQLEYRIYIINQFGTGKFNRAKLMNVGYAESIRDHSFDCFVFHDVDLILENDFAVYSCPTHPRHLSVGVDKFNYELPYPSIFGGVTELTKHQFQKVNGYSNSFWGWGGEDDDMYNRIKLRYMSISRYPAEISKYRMISHDKEPGNEENPHRFALIKRTGFTMRRDGINSLKYKVVAREDHTTYTNITVQLFGRA